MTDRDAHVFSLLAEVPQVLSLVRTAQVKFLEVTTLSLVRRLFFDRSPVLTLQSGGDAVLAQVNHWLLWEKRWSLKGYP